MLQLMIIFTLIGNVKYTVTLHALQTLLIKVVYLDLSGTKIVSNYPLTVIGGHQCATVPVLYFYCDPIATQVPPTINWGNNSFRYHYRIVLMIKGLN